MLFGVYLLNLSGTRATTLPIYESIHVQKKNNFIKSLDDLRTICKIFILLF